jgi:hypothetical protein
VSRPATRVKTKLATTSKLDTIALLVVEPKQKLLIAFYPDGSRQDYTGERKIEDKLLTGLNLSVDSIWSEAQL